MNSLEWHIPLWHLLIIGISVVDFVHYSKFFIEIPLIIMYRTAAHAIGLSLMREICCLYTDKSCREVKPMVSPPRNISRKFTVWSFSISPIYQIDNFHSDQIHSANSPKRHCIFSSLFNSPPLIISR
jgi:hypothetical protein